MKKSAQPPKLTWAQYWEWRTTISEMKISKQLVELTESNIKLLRKDAEIILVRAELLSRVNLENSRAVLDDAQKEYERFKKVLEDSLGTTLTGKLIDEITLEVKDLPDETK